MALATRSRRWLLRPLAAALTGVLAILLAAAPAQATYSPPQLVYFQLQAQHSTTGVIYYLGRASGTIQFDDDNSSYYLSITICRQSSYSPPILRVYINGTSYHQGLTGSSVGRTPECDDRPTNVINSAYTYNGVINSITLVFEGIFFEDYYHVRTVTKSSTYDNPFN